MLCCSSGWSLDLLVYSLLTFMLNFSPFLILIPLLFLISLIALNTRNNFTRDFKKELGNGFVVSKSITTMSAVKVTF